MKILLTSSIILGILGVVYLLAICCGYRSLKIAIDVIDASADFLAATKRIMIVPIVYFFMTLIILAMWIPCMIAIGSIAVYDIEADKSYP